MIPTNNSDLWLPDEAYTASSIATGYPVKEGAISMDSSGAELTTIFDIAKQYHKKSALITNSSISYITSACFTVHSENWEDEYFYAGEILDTDLDLLLGGGRKFFLENEEIDSFPPPAENWKYHYINSLSQLKEMDKNKQILGLFAEEELNSSDPQITSLQEMTQKALDYLGSSKDFILLINDNQIDWYSHQKEEKKLLLGLRNISNALETAISYQEKNPNTLVLLIGAYDCGGFSITESVQYGSRGMLKQNTRRHTGNFAPIFALGRYHDKFNGLFRPAELGQILKKIAAQ